MGRMGKTRYHSAVAHGGFEIVGICDTDEAMLQQNYGAPAFTDWKACIDTCKPDAVFVCTINAAIPDVVCYALEHGIHVFSEKPPGRTCADAERMEQAWKQSVGLVLKFGFNHRYHNSIIEARALIDSGILGDVVCARGVYGKAGNENFANEWRNNMTLSGGGILLDQGIHMLDLLSYFVGEFASVQSRVSNLVWKNIPTEDSAFAILETTDGKIASLHSSVLQWRHKFDLDIICTNGYIALNGLLTSTKSYGEERITYYRKDLSNVTSRLGRPKEHTMCFNSDDSWDIELAEFYDAIVYHVPIQNGTPHDGVYTMQLIEKIYQSRN